MSLLPFSARSALSIKTNVEMLHAGSSSIVLKVVKCELPFLFDASTCCDDESCRFHEALKQMQQRVVVCVDGAGDECVLSICSNDKCLLLRNREIIVVNAAVKQLGQDGPTEKARFLLTITPNNSLACIGELPCGLVYLFRGDMLARCGNLPAMFGAWWT